MVVAVTRPQAQGYGVLLGTDYFRLAPDRELPVTIHTRDSLAQRTDQRGNPDENVLEVGFAFSRSNLTGGEGLDWWPRETGEAESPTDLIRYWDSENIAIRRPSAGAPYTLELVPAILDFWTPAATPVDAGTSRDRLYIIEGTNVHRFNDLGDTTPDDTDNLAVTLTQLAVGADNSVAVLDNTGDVWFKGSQTDTYLKVYDTPTNGDPAVGVWYVKDRIIIATNDAASAAQGLLREVAPVVGGTPAAPTVTPTFSTFDSFEGECYAVVDAGHAIVAAMSDGSLRSYVPQTDTAGGTPVLTIRARVQVPIGEVSFALGANLGVLLVFTIEEVPGASTTTMRVYRGSVLDERFDFAVGALQLLRSWAGSVETVGDYVKRIVSIRDEIIFAVGEAANTWSLWRYDLVTSGVFRHHSTNQTAIDGLFQFDGVLGWIEGATVVTEDTTKVVTEGYLITPNITFGLNTPINWTSFTLEVDNLVGGAEVRFFYSLDHSAILDPDDPSWVQVASYLDASQSGVEQPVINATATQVALMVKLFASGDQADSPEVARFATRGLPKHRDWLIDLPINVSDMVEAPGRMPLHVPGLGNTVHSRLVALQGASLTCQVFGPSITVRGIVDTILEPTTYRTPRGSQSRRCMVRVIGVLVGTEADSFVQGNEGMGIPLMGVTTMGIGEETT